MKTEIEKHLSHDDYLETHQVLKILEEYPDCLYQGIAYRILVFSHPTNECNVSEDYSFSKSLNGIRYYFDKQDPSYYKEVHLYQCNIKGLDLQKINEILNLKNNEMIQKEEEVILGSFFESKLIFKGSFLDFDIFLKK